MRKFLLIVLAHLFFLASFSQSVKPKVKGWHLMDYQQDGYRGISLNKAYELLKGRKSKPTIVAVIDSGIDTLQEDLKDVLWVNTKELQGNGIDDDHNGYVDDRYGWNFCGSKSGENESRNTFEVARVYHHWKAEFEGKKEKQIPDDRKFLYSQWKKSEKILNEKYVDAVKELPDITNFLKLLNMSNSIILSKLGITEFSSNTLEKVDLSKKDSLSVSAGIWKNVLERAEDTSVKNTAVLNEIDNYKNNLENDKKRKEELPEDFRGALTKDNYEDINDRFYGNNNLKGFCGNHGTSVSSIIGAVRNNNIGVDGIADNVKIMMIRAAPGGDEHDKDVALAIRYAVDNGASVINMSFGKPVSPYKQFVDDAIRYASEKGVLLVHASGNDGVDIDENVFYPNSFFLDGKKADNLITVGASADASLGTLVAPFSNYGVNEVDIFAPGMYIYCANAGNTYEAADGTSVASPVVAGVAALLRSYFPELTPPQVIDIIMKSGVSINEDVELPGSKNKTSFNKLCKSGKIINAYEAVKLAIEMTKK